MAEEIDSIPSVGAVGSADLGVFQQGASSAAPAAGAAVAPARVAPAPARQPTVQDLHAAVQQVNEHLVSVNRVMELHVDGSTGLTIATIRNSSTGEVLQQIPGTDIVDLARMLASWAPGKNILLDLIA